MSQYELTYSEAHNAESNLHFKGLGCIAYQPCPPKKSRRVGMENEGAFHLNGIIRCSTHAAFIRALVRSADGVRHLKRFFV